MRKEFNDIDTIEFVSVKERVHDLLEDGQLESISIEPVEWYKSLYEDRTWDIVELWQIVLTEIDGDDLGFYVTDESFKASKVSFWRDLNSVDLARAVNGSTFFGHSLIIHKTFLWKDD